MACRRRKKWMRMSALLSKTVAHCHHSLATEWAYVRSVMRVPAIVSFLEHIQRLTLWQNINHPRERMRLLFLLHIDGMQQIMLSCWQRIASGNGLCPLKCPSIWSILWHPVNTDNEPVSSGNGRAKWPNYRAESQYEVRGSSGWWLVMNYEKETVLRMMSCRADAPLFTLLPAPTTSYQLRKWPFSRYLSFFSLSISFKQHTHK